jgi:hypothetical protein
VYERPSPCRKKTPFVTLYPPPPWKLVQDEDILLIPLSSGVVRNLKKLLERTYHSPLKVKHALMKTMFWLIMLHGSVRHSYWPAQIASSTQRRTKSGRRHELGRGIWRNCHHHDDYWFCSPPAAGFCRSDSKQVGAFSYIPMFRPSHRLGGA